MVVLIFHSIIFMKVSYVSKGGGRGGMTLLAFVVLLWTPPLAWKIAPPES